VCRSGLSEEAPPEQPAHADASPFQPKQKAPLLERAVPVSVARAKTPLTARLAEFGLSGISLHPTVRAAVEAAG
jgi:hypothetical protein